MGCGWRAGGSTAARSLFFLCFCFLFFSLGYFKISFSGEVGDWKNHFNEEEAETFDREFYKVLDTDRFHFLHNL